MTVSVVIPTHNRGDRIEQAVKSVLNQTYQSLEVIVVSDGSTDDTDEVMEKMIEYHPGKIKFHSYQESKGANHARNIGIKHSTGEYVAFLDDDDEWIEDKIEKQLEVFEADSEIGVVYTGINIIYVNEGLTYYSLSGYEGDLSKEILQRNLLGATPNVMVRKDVLDNVGYFDEEMPAKQDYDLWIRVCQQAKVGFVKEAKVQYYNYTGEKQISSNTKKHERAIQLIQQKYQELFAQLSKDELKQRDANFYISIANVALRNNHKRLAAKYAFKALKSKPSLKHFAYLLMTPVSFSLLLKLKSRMGI